MVSKYLLFALIVGIASAATWRNKLPPKPREFANKEGCYVKEINDVIPFTATLTPKGFCYRITCNEALLTYASCGTPSLTDPQCYVTQEDLSKTYLQCCPHLHCE